jgi:hypothetical protein
LNDQQEEKIEIGGKMRSKGGGEEEEGKILA